MPSSLSVPSMQDLLEAGVHFGHQTRRGDPRMRDYIFGARGGVHIINLEESEKRLKAAAEFVYQLGKMGKVLLFVGTKKQAQPIIEEAASKTGAPFVTFRWIGGVLTNFDEVRRNIKKLLELRDLKDKGELTRYTKKEQLLISRRLDRFDLMWGGVAKLDSLPDAVFVADSAGERTAISEAIRMGIPVVGVTDTNSNPMAVDYPIPGNDDATKSIKILVETIAEAYGQGLKESLKLKIKSEKLEAETKQKEAEDNAQIATAVAVAEEEVEKKEVVESARKE